HPVRLVSEGGAFAASGNCTAIHSYRLPPLSMKGESKGEGAGYPQNNSPFDKRGAPHPSSLRSRFAPRNHFFRHCEASQREAEAISYFTLFFLIARGSKRKPSRI
ncbi:MAG: hypothetical protein ACPLPS_10540, partial [bacterium]